MRYQSASVSGLWYPAKKPGDIIKVGEYLGCVKDYEGNILETSLSDLNGVVLYQAGSLQVIKDGPMITYGSFSRRKDERKEKITNYWAKRSDSFRMIHLMLSSPEILPGHFRMQQEHIKNGFVC